MYSVGLLEDIIFKGPLLHSLGFGVVCLGYLKPRDISSFLKKCRGGCQRLLFFESVGPEFTAKTGYTTRPLEFYLNAFEKAKWDCHSHREVTFPKNANGEFDPMCAFALHFKG